MYIALHSLLSLHIFVYFMKKEPFTKFYVFNHFSVTCEVTNFWWIKLWINVSDVITTKEQTKYASWGLHVILWNFVLMSYCFKMKKDFFMQKMLLWPQVPFKFRVDRQFIFGFFLNSSPVFFWSFFSSFSCNSISCSGCSALHEVNPNFWKNILKYPHKQLSSKDVLNLLPDMDVHMVFCCYLNKFVTVDWY